MQLKKILMAISAMAVLWAMVPMHAGADDKVVKVSAKKGGAKIYEEEEFLKLFQNRSRKQVGDALGKPVRVGQASKPTGAEATLGRPLDQKKGASIEMWYYEDKVRYDPKHTYKTVELTFVNDRCLNITYFNNR